jgi:CBS domain-containing protein
MQAEVIVVEEPDIEEAANHESEAVAAEFEEVKADVAAGREPSRSVRELLRWFGARRRRGGVVERIEAELEAADIRTDPHFTTTWIDAPVTFKKREPQTPAAEADPVVAAQPGAEAAEDVKPTDVAEMTHLVRMLEAANREVISVNPQDPIERAITLMLAYDFSQLAVMTGPRDLKGAISWKSIGSRLSQRNALTCVSDAMEQATEVSDADSLFEVTKTIIQRNFVFVRAADRKITGIVTATDLSEQFQGLSEPFLLLGRIENQIRKLIQGVFDVEVLRAACDDNDADRKAAVTKASQLTFGEYQRIFEKEENWAQLGFVACRKTFCKELDEVRKLRNEIMHFHPDVIEDGDFEQLRRFSRLLEQLDQLAA